MGRRLVPDLTTCLVTSGNAGLRDAHDCRKCRECSAATVVVCRIVVHHCAYVLHRGTVSQPLVGELPDGRTLRTVRVDRLPVYRKIRDMDFSDDHVVCHLRRRPQLTSGAKPKRAKTMHDGSGTMSGIVVIHASLSPVGLTPWPTNVWSSAETLDGQRGRILKKRRLLARFKG